jgi:hypothetical protein
MRVQKQDERKFIFERRQCWGLRLLLGVGSFTAVYVPSTMVASGGVTSMPGATVSPWGREADSSIAGEGFSSVAAVLCSSSS